MTGYIKFVDIGDNHGDEENPDATSALFDFLDDFKPDLVVHGGDNWNFNYLREGASAKDEDSDSRGDWQCGSEFFLRYMSYGKTRVFLRGNHDERLWNTYKRATKEAVRRHAMRGIEDVEALVRRRKVHMLPYNSRSGVLDIDGYRTIHGYAHDVGAARKFAASYGTCSYHHTHAMDIGIFERWPEPSIAYGTGCLMKIDQDYNSTQMNKLRHENGWLYGWCKAGERPHIFQARQSADRKFVTCTHAQKY